MKLRKICKNKLAFTLVELVVVIAIMAILAGAVAGAVVGIRTKADKDIVNDGASKVATQLGLMIANGEITDTMSADSLATQLGNQLSGCKVYTKEPSAWPTDDSNEKIPFIVITPSTKPPKGWLKVSTNFVIKSEKYSATVTMDGLNGKAEISAKAA